MKPMSMASTIGASLLGLSFFAFNYTQAKGYEDLAMPMLKAVSISWSEAALRQYLPEDIYAQNRVAYAVQLSKFKYLGYIKKCKTGFFKQSTTSLNDTITLKETCTFQQGKADVQVSFKTINGKDQMVDFSISRASTNSTTNRSSGGSWITKFWSKSKKSSRRSRRR